MENKKHYYEQNIDFKEEDIRDLYALVDSINYVLRLRAVKLDTARELIIISHNALDAVKTKVKTNG